MGVAPTHAFAEVCDKARPNWDGLPTNGWDEAVFLFLSPVGLFLIGATAVAVAFRHALGVGLTCVMWAFFVTAAVLPDPTEIKSFAMTEGCIASPALFTALVAAICLSAVLITIRREKRL